MSHLGESIRENCRHTYINYKDVPSENCVKCSEKSWCGKTHLKNGKQP
jgi:hypothetical protein